MIHLPKQMLSCLERAGLRYKEVVDTYCQCPTHEDQNPKVQIYKDDWFVNCHADGPLPHHHKSVPRTTPSVWLQLGRKRAELLSNVVENKR